MESSGPRAFEVCLDANEVEIDGNLSRCWPLLDTPLEVEMKAGPEKKPSCSPSGLRY